MGDASEPRERTRPRRRRQLSTGERAALGSAARAVGELDAALLELRRAAAGSERAGELARVLIADLTAAVPFTDPELSAAPLHGLEFALGAVLDVADGRFAPTTGTRTHALRVLDGRSFTYCGQPVREPSAAPSPHAPVRRSWAGWRTAPCRRCAAHPGLPDELAEMFVYGAVHGEPARTVAGLVAGQLAAALPGARDAGELLDAGRRIYDEQLPGALAQFAGPGLPGEGPSHEHPWLATPEATDFDQAAWERVLRDTAAAWHQEHPEPGADRDVEWLSDVLTGVALRARADARIAALAAAGECYSAWVSHGGPLEPPICVDADWQVVVGCVRDEHVSVRLYRHPDAATRRLVATVELDLDAGRMEWQPGEAGTLLPGGAVAPTGSFDTGPESSIPGVSARAFAAAGESYADLIAEGRVSWPGIRRGKVGDWGDPYIGLHVPGWRAAIRRLARADDVKVRTAQRGGMGYAYLPDAETLCDAQDELLRASAHTFAGGREPFTLVAAVPGQRTSSARCTRCGADVSVTVTRGEVTVTGPANCRPSK